MTQLLSEQEIIDLTGAKSSTVQKRVLQDQGIKFLVRTDGKIRTTWEAINSVLLQKKQDDMIDGPNLNFPIK